MIRPIISYCSNIFLKAPPSYKAKLQSIQDRAYNIVKSKNTKPAWISIEAIHRRKAVVDVFKCINHLSPCVFENYFTKLNHRIRTRGNNSSLVIPRVKTEAAQRSFMYQGAYISNTLDKNSRDEKSYILFRKKF